MAKIEKIGNIQIVDNKEDKFFYFPMISMACTGSGYEEEGASKDAPSLFYSPYLIFEESKQAGFARCHSMITF